MTAADGRRFAAVLARAAPLPGVPSGVDPAELRLAMVEDTYEVLVGLELVTAALAPAPGDQPTVAALAWPGSPVLPVHADTDPARLAAVLAGCGGLGAGQAAVVAGDAPDLPRLLLGKLYRALGSAEVALCPAAGGGLVALAARLPAPDWLSAAGAGLDTPDAVGLLAAAAPSRRTLAFGPGWHRIRSGADLAALDPGLEGWDATRTLLAKTGR